MGEVRKNAPSTRLDDWHRNDDVDNNYEAHHHTLGMKYGQAMPGDLFKKMLDNGELGGGGGATEKWYELGTPPNNGTGANGDWGMVTSGVDAGKVYEKVAGAWTFRVDVNGADGISVFVYNDHGAVAGTARIGGFINIWRGSVYPTNSDAAIDMIVWTG